MFLQSLNLSEDISISPPHPVNIEGLVKYTSIGWPWWIYSRLVLLTARGGGVSFIEVRIFWYTGPPNTFQIKHFDIYVNRNMQNLCLRLLSWTKKPKNYILFTCMWAVDIMLRAWLKRQLSETEYFYETHRVTGDGKKKKTVRTIRKIWKLNRINCREKYKSFFILLASRIAVE